MNISIKGIGVLGGFGCGVAQLESALVRGSSPQNTVAMTTSDGSLEVPALTAQTDRLADFVDKSALRRLDHYIRMALLGSYLALEDAGMLDVKQRRMGIIVATGYGSTCNMMDIHQALRNDAPVISPTRFSNSVHNAAATHISIMLNEMSPSLSVNDYDMSIPSAFLSACQWLREKRVESVLVGGVDEYCRALGYNWHRRCHPGSPDKNAPADLRPEHAVIGEGACFFLLTGQEDASSYGFIDAVRMENYTRGRVDAAQGPVYFLSVDDYSEYDDLYAVYLPGKTKVASYAHIYGGLPIGMGFDIAIAALSHKTDKIYACAENARHHAGHLNVIRREEPLGAGGICCLKLGAGGILGSVHVKQQSASYNSGRNGRFPG
ncbi:MAG: beta-ketoacyl synthase N-terminal-like domain-containing protein [Desulfobacterales bacterium]|nr:beta-ketoacyl synthase N-terminal-like domain-containing protein [Desulfobacterales bacterium]